MGKQAKAHTAAVSNAAGALNGNFVRLGEMKADIEKLLKKMDGLADDPTSAEFTKAKATYDTLVTNVKTGVKHAEKNAQTLRTAIAAFKEYIKKKKDSKNPFLGKKSLSTSEAFVKLADDSLNDAQTSLASYDFFMASVK
jgi:phage shock protein A